MTPDKKSQSLAWKLEDFHLLKKLGNFFEKNKKETKIFLYNYFGLKQKGHGQFGSVYLIKHKDSTEMFALKCVAKQQIIEQNLEKYLKVSYFFLFLCFFIIKDI